MNKSDNLMKIIDCVDIFDHNEHYEGYGFATRAIDVGNYTDRSAVPIHASVTSSTRYQRNGDPSQDAIRCNIASLHHGKYCITTSSGMGGISLTLMSLLKHSDRIICHKDVYLWTDFFMKEDLPRLLNADVVMVDLTDAAALEAELKKAKTAIVFSEIISNPMLDVIDLKMCSDLAHKYGALHITDNTFASPYLCTPLDLGCDVVCESATKYINGHGDALAGAVVTNEHQIYYKLQRMMGAMGPCMSPYNAFMVSRGIQTLHIRMERHCASAQKVAEYLLTNPHVTKVIYPGLENHPGHEVAKKQLKNFGGMISILTDMDHDTIHNVFLHELKLFKHWVSLGEAHSLISPKDADEEKGIPADLIRISIGLEDPEDLIADIEHAFQVIYGDNK